ncbi:FRG domain-containing protein [Delftia lacustris]|uniref:FRG domain-containing protein n=1 Tax=Delftia lacustris TaxID=558537 RepID=UPI0035A668A1
MKKQRLVDLPSFLTLVADAKKNDVILFRGQSSSKPLLPKIARADPKKDTTDVEKTMLAELRRRGDMFFSTPNPDDWDLVVHAQHFGMATRLLDWSSNPLVALWFACANAKKEQSAFVYVFTVKDEYLLNRATDPDPFKKTKTRVFKPKLNNSRIVAQSGWFTAHKYSNTAGKFVALNVNPDLTSAVTEVEVPHEMHAQLLTQLNVLGVNYQAMFPDMEGLCKHINWLHE